MTSTPYVTLSPTGSSTATFNPSENINNTSGIIIAAAIIIAVLVMVLLNFKVKVTRKTDKDPPSSS
jgi:hypothetical protein